MYIACGYRYFGNVYICLTVLSLWAWLFCLHIRIFLHNRDTKRHYVFVHCNENKYDFYRVFFYFYLKPILIISFLHTIPFAVI